jgi:hypothetical protein
VRLVGAVAQPDHPSRPSARRDTRLPSPPWRRSRRCAHRASARAHAAAADATRRTGTAEPSYRRNCRSAARRATDCGTRRIRAGRRARPRFVLATRIAPRLRRAYESHSRAWPRRSRPTLACAMSSSRIGPCPIHSPRRCANTSGESPSRSRYSKIGSETTFRSTGEIGSGDGLSLDRGIRVGDDCSLLRNQLRTSGNRL